MRFTSVFAAGLAMGSSVMAAPANSPLYARDDCPSVKTITSWLKDNTNVGNNTVFYAGKTKARDAANLAFLAGGWSYNNISGKSQYKTWDDKCNNETTLDNRIREAVAGASKGVAWVLIKPGDKISDDSFWKTKEYPALKKNKVTIWAVDADNFDKQMPYDGSSDFSGSKVVDKAWYSNGDGPGDDDNDGDDGDYWNDDDKDGDDKDGDDKDDDDKDNGDSKDNSDGNDGSGSGNNN